MFLSNFVINSAISSHDKLRPTPKDAFSVHTCRAKISHGPCWCEPGPPHRDGAFVVSTKEYDV
jgi:hypothetical protein